MTDHPGLPGTEGLLEMHGYPCWGQGVFPAIHKGPWAGVSGPTAEFPLLQPSLQSESSIMNPRPQDGGVTAMSLPAPYIPGVRGLPTANSRKAEY